MASALHELCSLGLADADHALEVMRGVSFEKPRGLLRHLLGDMAGEQVLLAGVVERAALFLSWFLETGSSAGIGAVYGFIQGLCSVAEEVQLAFGASREATVALYWWFLRERRIDGALLLVQWDVMLQDMSLVDPLIETVYAAMGTVSVAGIEVVTELLWRQPRLLKRFLEHPSAGLFVEALVGRSESPHILQVSALVVLLTRDKALLDADNAARILKLAVAALGQDAPAASRFLRIACSKPTLATRLRRTLMGGLLRRLVADNAKDQELAVMELVLTAFETELLTADFVPPHAVPLDVLLRWLNGHGMECVRAVRLAAAMERAGLLGDGESRRLLQAEITSILQDESRLAHLAALFQAAGRDVLGLLLDLAARLDPAGGGASPPAGAAGAGLLARLAAAYLLVYGRRGGSAAPEALCEAAVFLHQHGFAARPLQAALPAALGPVARLLDRQAAAALGALLAKLRSILLLSRQPPAAPAVDTALTDRMMQQMLTLDRALGDRLQQIRGLEEAVRARDGALQAVQAQLGGEQARRHRHQAALEAIQAELGGYRQGMLQLARDSEAYNDAVSGIVGDLKDAVGQLAAGAQQHRRQHHQDGLRIGDLEAQLLMAGEEARLVSGAIEQARRASAESARLLQDLRQRAAEDAAAAAARTAALEAQLAGLAQQHQQLQEEARASRAAEAQLQHSVDALKGLVEMKEGQVAAGRSEVAELTRQLLARHT